MTRSERENWITSIECCINHIMELKEDGYRDVEFILRKHGAGSVEDLQPWQYSDVFNELDALEADLK